MLKEAGRLVAKEGYYEMYTTITPKKTLQERKPTALKVRRGGPAEKLGRESLGKSVLGVGEIYEIIVAERWSMPRTFQPGHAGHKRWERKQRHQAEYGEGVRKIYEGLRHPGVPRWMSDIVHRVAADTDKG